MSYLVSKVGTYQFQESEIRVLEDSGQAEVVIENIGDSTVSATLK